MSFGNRLRALRKKKNISQQELANELSVTDGTISNYEKNVAFPRWDKILKLCEILDVDPNYLFWDDLSDKIKSKIAKQATSSNDAIYEKLNSVGKAKADEYIEDLFANPKYTTEEPPSPFDDIFQRFKQDTSIEFIGSKSRE